MSKYQVRQAFLVTVLFLGILLGHLMTDASRNQSRRCWTERNTVDPTQADIYCGKPSLATHRLAWID